MFTLCDRLLRGFEFSNEFADDLCVNVRVPALDRIETLEFALDRAKGNEALNPADLGQPRPYDRGAALGKLSANGFQLGFELAGRFAAALRVFELEGDLSEERFEVELRRCLWILRNLEAWARVPAASGYAQGQN